METDILELKATVRGFASSILTNMIVFVLSLFGMLWLSGLIMDAYVEMRVNSIWAYLDATRHFREGLWYMNPPAAHLAWWILAIVAVSCVLGIFGTILYSASEVNVFTKKDGHWAEVSSTKYSFPFGTTTKQEVFDRVINIEIVRTSMDVIFGTGTIKLKLVTFTNASSDESVWEISAIADPYGVKKQLEAAFRPHQGLLTRITTAAPLPAA